MASKKKSQTYADRKKAGRFPVGVFFDKEDMHRLEVLGFRWGMTMQRDVLREALKRAVENG